VRELAPEITERNYAKQPLTATEIEELIRVAGGVGPILSTRNATAKERGWSAATPPARAEFVAAAVADNNLIRRPILVRDGQVVIGKDVPAIRRLLG
jgi:arsenate reductase-like glutaredoxin family protein